MKGFIEEYGKIILVVCVILLMLAFSKAGLANQIGDSIVAVVNDLQTTSESYQSQAQLNKQVFDINYNLDGKLDYFSIPNIITYDVYINNKLVAKNYADYCIYDLPEGSSISIRNIRLKPGYKFLGYSIGESTIAANQLPKQQIGENNRIDIRSFYGTNTCLVWHFVTE